MQKKCFFSFIKNVFRSSGVVFLCFLDVVDFPSLAWVLCFFGGFGVRSLCLQLAGLSPLDHPQNLLKD